MVEWEGLLPHEALKRNPGLNTLMNDLMPHDGNMENENTPMNNANGKVSCPI